MDFRPQQARWEELLPRLLRVPKRRRGERVSDTDPLKAVEAAPRGPLGIQAEVQVHVVQRQVQDLDGVRGRDKKE